MIPRLQSQDPIDIVIALQSQGCVVLEDLFSTSMLQACQHTFLRQYRRYLTDVVDHKDAQRVGHKRWMVTVTLKPPFDDPMLFANPTLMEAAHQLLGGEFLLNNFGVVVSLPGAEAQHDHRDLPALFDDNPIHTQLPCYALTILIPLVDLNEIHGSTLLRPGSHVVSETEAKQMPGEAPDVLRGSCMVMDYRLQHSGTANQSQVPRPLLFLVYSRPWFRDYRNFRKQPPLQVTRSSLRRMTPEHQHLLRFAKQTWW